MPTEEEGQKSGISSKEFVRNILTTLFSKYQHKDPSVILLPWLQDSTASPIYTIDSITTPNNLKDLTIHIANPSQF